MMELRLFKVTSKQILQETFEELKGCMGPLTSFIMKTKVIRAKAYSEYFQTSKMKFSAKIFNDLQL